MVNKINSKTGLIAAVLVGMTLSHAPVQAGWDMETTKKVVGVVWSQTKTASNSAFKWIKTAIKLGCIVGGSAHVASALVALRVNRNIPYRDSYDLGIQLGAGFSVLVLASLYLYQEFKSEKKDKESDED